MKQTHDRRVPQLPPILPGTHHPPTSNMIHSQLPCCLEVPTPATTHTRREKPERKQPSNVKAPSRTGRKSKASRHSAAKPPKNPWRPKNAAAINHLPQLQHPKSTELRRSVNKPDSHTSPKHRSPPIHPPPDVPISGYQRPSLPTQGKTSTRVPPLPSHSAPPVSPPPAEGPAATMPLNAKNAEYLPAPPLEEEQSLEIEFSEPDQPAERNSHLPLGLLKEAWQAIASPARERPAPLYLVLQGRRNNLSPLELAKITEITRKRGGRNRFDYTPPKARNIYRCPLPTDSGDAGPNAPNQC